MADVQDDDSRSSVPSNAEPLESVLAQNAASRVPPTRVELRERALETRNSYQIGALPGEDEGAEIDRVLPRSRRLTWPIQAS